MSPVPASMSPSWRSATLATAGAEDECMYEICTCPHLASSARPISVIVLIRLGSMPGAGLETFKRGLGGAYLKPWFLVIINCNIINSYSVYSVTNECQIYNFKYCNTK